MVRKSLATVGVVLLAAGAGFSLRGCEFAQRPVTLTSLSPDDTLRVTVVEFPAGIDRNFEVRVEEVASHRSQTVFRSPDEGRPIGSERVVWAADGSRFLLLGRHFYVTEAGELTSGDQAYLMMDVNSGRVWCNASQQSKYTNFGPADLRAIKWRGWTLPDDE